MVRKEGGRKERQPNWTQIEIAALIQAKKEKFLHNLDNVHDPNLMRREATQWSEISAKVMEICGEHAECKRHKRSCKEKWGTLLVDYKKIFDHHKGTGTSSYWDMTILERVSLHLPRNFLRDNYDNIDDWFHIKPIMNPPHSRDLSQPGDAVYDRAATLGKRCLQDMQHVNSGSSDVGVLASTSIRHGQESTLVGLGGVGVSLVQNSPVAFTHRQRASTPSPDHPAPTDNPLDLVKLSSSEASFVDLTKKFGNTGQRRKSISGHKQIAEATQNSGENLVKTMEKLNEQDRKLQWDIFQEQLKYNKQRDMIA